MKNTPRIIAVEGFDGAGKTTLSRYISDYYDYIYHKSPTGIFAKVRDEFDKQHVTFAERLPFYTGDCIRVSLLISEHSESKFVLDRYYYSTIAYHEAKEKNVTKPLLNIFNSMKQPDLVFIIKTDFNVLNDRINNRNIKSLNDELFLKKELYNKIYQLYDTYINVPCYIINNNGTIKESKTQIDNVLMTFNNK